ncbi:hypothetical protein KQI84_02055 [bacterium]|nr:hypothetical protein [bacterium]
MIGRSATPVIIAVVCIVSVQARCTAASVDFVADLPGNVHMNFMYVPTPPCPAQWGIYRDYYIAKMEMTAEEWNSLPGSTVSGSMGESAAAMSRAEVEYKLEQLEQYLRTTGQGEFEAILPDWNRRHYVFIQRDALTMRDMDSSLDEWSSHYWDERVACGTTTVDPCYLTHLYKFSGDEELEAGTSQSWPTEGEAKQDAFSNLRFGDVGVRVILLPKTSLAKAHHEYQFSDDAEGWQSFTVPPLDSPIFSTSTGTNGALEMTGTGSSNLVGIWQSPVMALAPMGVQSTPQIIALPVHMTTGPPTIVLTYRVRTNEPTPTLVPSFRVRVTATNSQFADVLHIDSNADAAYSPTPEGREYVMHFQAPFSSQEFQCQFDMLNFDPGDNSTAMLALDTATIEGAGNLGLSNPRLEHVYTFDEGQDGWISASLSPTYAEPLFAYDTINGRLGIQVANIDGFQFGFWGSSTDPANNVTIEANRLYYGIFSVSTNVSNADLVPTFRLRFNESFFRASRYTVVASTGSADFSPVENAPRDYIVYFPANVGISQSLLTSFDLLVDPFSEGIDPGIALYLDRVEIFSVPWPN